MRDPASGKDKKQDKGDGPGMPRGPMDKFVVRKPRGTTEKGVMEVEAGERPTATKRKAQDQRVDVGVVVLDDSDGDEGGGGGAGGGGAGGAGPMIMSEDDWDDEDDEDGGPVYGDDGGGGGGPQVDTDSVWTIDDHDPRQLQFDWGPEPVSEAASAMDSKDPKLPTAPTLRRNVTASLPLGVDPAAVARGMFVADAGYLVKLEHSPGVEFFQELVLDAEEHKAVRYVGTNPKKPRYFCIQEGRPNPQPGTTPGLSTLATMGTLAGKLATAFGQYADSVMGPSRVCINGYVLVYVMDQDMAFHFDKNQFAERFLWRVSLGSEGNPMAGGLDFRLPGLGDIQVPTPSGTILIKSGQISTKADLVPMVVAGAKHRAYGNPNGVVAVVVRDYVYRDKQVYRSGIPRFEATAEFARREKPAAERLQRCLDALRPKLPRRPMLSATAWRELLLRVPRSDWAEQGHLCGMLNVLFCEVVLGRRFIKGVLTSEQWAALQAGQLTLAQAVELAQKSLTRWGFARITSDGLWVQKEKDGRWTRPELEVAEELMEEFVKNQHEDADTRKALVRAVAWDRFKIFDFKMAAASTLGEASQASREEAVGHRGPLPMSLDTCVALQVADPEAYDKARHDLAERAGHASIAAGGGFGGERGADASDAVQVWYRWRVDNTPATADDYNKPNGPELVERLTEGGAAAKGHASIAAGGGFGGERGADASDAAEAAQESMASALGKPRGGVFGGAMPKGGTAAANSAAQGSEQQRQLQQHNTQAYEQQQSAYGTESVLKRGGVVAGIGNGITQQAGRSGHEVQFKVWGKNVRFGTYATAAEAADIQAKAKAYIKDPSSDVGQALPETWRKRVDDIRKERGPRTPGTP